MHFWTPYRLLCNDVQREDAKPSPDLASWLYSNVPLHKIRYGIHFCSIHCLLAVVKNHFPQNLFSEPLRAKVKRL